MVETFRRHVTIEATPGVVWQALTDLERCQAFMPDVTRIEIISGDGFEVGTRWRETRKMRLFGFIPIKGSAEIEVQSLKKNDQYATVADDGANWARYTFDLARHGKATRVELLAEFKGVGKYAGNDKVAKRLCRFCEKADDQLLERLKTYVETDGHAHDGADRKHGVPA